MDDTNNLVGYMFSGHPLDMYQLQKILKEKRQGCVLPTKHRTIIRRL